MGDGRAFHFAREMAGRLKAFTGIPVNRENGAYEPHFYRGTPTCIAWLNLWAGPIAAQRVTHIIAELAIFFLRGWLR